MTKTAVKARKKEKAKIKTKAKNRSRQNAQRPLSKCLCPGLFLPKPDCQHLGFSLTRLDQHLLRPAQLDELNTAQVADPEVVLFIRHHDMDRGDIQSAVFAKKGDPLCLE